MVNEKLQEALNREINAEFASAYLYLSLAAHFGSTGLPGFAHWMKVQAQEEVGHAVRFFDHLMDRGGRVTLMAIDQPPGEFGSAASVFEQVLERERTISSAIHDLHDLAVQESDHASLPLLLSFIAEQIEEEKAVTDILDQLRMVGEQKGSLLFLDRHLAKR